MSREYKPTPIPKFLPRAERRLLRDMQEQLSRSTLTPGPGANHNIVISTTNGVTLPEGTALGQMMYWDGSAWVVTSDVRFIPSFSFPLTVTAAMTVQKTADEAFNISDGGGTDYLLVDTVNGIVRLNNGTCRVESRILLSGGIAVGRISVASSPYNVTATDIHLSVNTNAARTINLPAASAFGGNLSRILIVKDAVGTGADTNNITIVPDGTDTIDQVAANLVINTLRGSERLFSDGVSNWERW